LLGPVDAPHERACAECGSILLNWAAPWRWCNPPHGESVVVAWSPWTDPLPWTLMGSPTLFQMNTKPTRSQTGPAVTAIDMWAYHKWQKEPGSVTSISHGWWNWLADQLGGVECRNYDDASMVGFWGQELKLLPNLLTLWTKCCSTTFKQNVCECRFDSACAWWPDNVRFCHLSNSVGQLGQLKVVLGKIAPGFKVGLQAALRRGISTMNVPEVHEFMPQKLCSIA
jgi:hypothetical protein